MINRKEALENIKRFNDYKIMFYRDNVLLHSKRVLLLMQEVMPILTKSYDNFNIDLALALPLIHDDAEIITGDVTLYQKELMTKKQLLDVAQNEAKAIEIISAQMPVVFLNVNYKEALYHVYRKDCIEAQVVSFLDKFDGMCMSLHELHAGNKPFVEPVELYTRLLREFPDKYPKLQKIIYHGNGFFAKWEPINTERIINNSKPHDEYSIIKPSGILQYDIWKQIMISGGNMQHLTTKVE